MQITDYPSSFNIYEGMPLTAIISVVFNLLLMTGGLAGIIVIIIGGARYLASAGSSSRTRDAKKQIFAGVLGLIILFSSWVIINSINPNLTSIQEPSVLPVPEVTPPIPPEKPPVPDSAAFYYIPLGKIIDDVVSQEKETIPKMRSFANSTNQCNAGRCEGGSCDYWVSDSCGDNDPATDCSDWKTCSADCTTRNPCDSDKAEVKDAVITAANNMEKEMAQLQQAKSRIGECVMQEDTILLSCQEVLDIFTPEEGDIPSEQWDEVQDCRQGYDFYCLYGTDETGWLDEIILPLETIEEAIAKTRDLGDVILNCNCSNSSFSCGDCSGGCSGTPCPAQTYVLLAEALAAVDELEVRLNKLKDTITEITGLSMADEIITLTCSEAYSWLKSIKQSGCPGEKVFPCCPVDEETETIIRACQNTDFFFCSAP